MKSQTYEIRVTRKSMVTSVIAMLAFLFLFGIGVLKVNEAIADRIICSRLTYAEAQTELPFHPELDRDHDGIACENSKK